MPGLQGSRAIAGGQAGVSGTQNRGGMPLTGSVVPTHTRT